MENISAKAPWRNHLGEVPFTLDYFDGSMFEAVEKIAEKYPNNVAFDFMGRSTPTRPLSARSRTAPRHCAPSACARATR